jgi:hypothetical protein
VLLPRSAPWLDDFVTEFASFTGVDDLHDDMVDGFSSGYEAGQEPSWQHAMKEIAKARANEPSSEDRFDELRQEIALRYCDACKVFHMSACPKAAAG